MSENDEEYMLDISGKANLNDECKEEAGVGSGSVVSYSLSSFTKNCGNKEVNTGLKAN